MVYFPTYKTAMHRGSSLAGAGYFIAALTSTSFSSVLASATFFSTLASCLSAFASAQVSSVPSLAFAWTIFSALDSAFSTVASAFASASVTSAVEGLAILTADVDQNKTYRTALLNGAAFDFFSLPRKGERK